LPESPILSLTGVNEDEIGDSEDDELPCVIGKVKETVSGDRLAKFVGEFIP